MLFQIDIPAPERGVMQTGTDSIVGQADSELRMLSDHAPLPAALRRAARGIAVLGTAAARIAGFLG